jgi:hypothetical protein
MIQKYPGLKRSNKKKDTIVSSASSQRQNCSTAMKKRWVL